MCRKPTSQHPDLGFSLQKSFDCLRKAPTMPPHLIHLRTGLPHRALPSPASIRPLPSPGRKLRVFAPQDTWDWPAELWLAWQHGACCVAKDDEKHMGWSPTMYFWVYRHWIFLRAASPNNEIGWFFDHAVVDLSFDLLALMSLCALNILRFIFPPRWSNAKTAFVDSSWVEYECSWDVHLLLKIIAQ